MKNLKRLPTVLVATFYLLLFSFNSSAQNAEINSTEATPDESALLDLSSTNKGFSPPIGFTCGDDITDTHDNKTYGTVEIGNQCWMSENLNYTPTSGNSWCYDDDANNCNTYGRLYDWDAAMNNASSSSTNPSDVQGACPAGWHLPSDAEWKELEMHLGMTQTEADGTGWRGTDQGNQLKSSSPAWDGTNTSGFTALPGGLRDSNGSFYLEGSLGYWWSATESGSGAWSRDLSSSQSAVYRNTHGKGYGYSVRCVRN